MTGPKHFCLFIQQSASSVRFSNAEDVVATALRILEREKTEGTAKLTLLRNAIDEGIVGEDVEGDVIEQFDRSAVSRRPWV